MHIARDLSAINKIFSLNNDVQYKNIENIQPILFI